MDRPGGALLLCKCSYIGTYLCRKPNRAESARIGQSNVSACIDSDRPMEVPAADCGEAPLRQTTTGRHGFAGSLVRCNSIRQSAPFGSGQVLFRNPVNDAGEGLQLGTVGRSLPPEAWTRRTWNGPTSCRTASREQSGRPPGQHRGNNENSSAHRLGTKVRIPDNFNQFLHG